MSFRARSPACVGFACGGGCRIFHRCFVCWLGRGEWGKGGIGVRVGLGLWGGRGWLGGKARRRTVLIRGEDQRSGNGRTLLMPWYFLWERRGGPFSAVRAMRRKKGDRKRRGFYSV